MKRVAVADLKSHLSRYLSEVREGEELLVTSTGKTIAKIVPIQSREKSIEELEQCGIVKAGGGDLPEDFWSRPRPEDSHDSVREALIMERTEGR
jgi:prevent-host-death family protein